MPEDIKAMLDVVSRTQAKTTVIPADTPEVTFKDVTELIQFLSVGA